jgi:predicted transcriptional regulator
MEINLTPELHAKLAHIAAENNSGAEEYVRQLVEHYLDHDAWFRQKVKTGLAQLAQGEFVTHEEIGARIDQMFRS